jgi:fibro-slime domain-containing protein
MALPSRGRRFVIGSAVWLVAIAAAATSCSESHHGDDDDDSSGEAGMHSGSGGSQGGSGSGGKSAGGSVGKAGSATTGGATGSSGETGTGGDATTTAGTGTGGTSGSGTGGTDVSNAGAAGDCSGDACALGICGNGALEPGEICDDGNALPFDGCSVDCQLEPECEGAACIGTCGDGIIVTGEECDDGNTKDADGCSASCTVEDGYTCTAAQCDQIGGTCVVRLPAVFRDFNASGVAGGHPDFEPGTNSAGAMQGLVVSVLDAEGKPEQADLTTSQLSLGFMHGKAAFAEWYRNDAPASKPISGEIVLWDDGQGGFVNRWGANGEQFPGDESFPYYCGYGDCSVCPTPGPDETCGPCPDVPTYSCLVSHAAFDGNPLFFPIDPPAIGILTDLRGEGKVPEQYGWLGWPWESYAADKLGITTPVITATAPFPATNHNFSFTTELKFWFRYDASKPQILRFTGDDDVWVFVNGHLAVDLGGWHVPLDGTLTITGGVVQSTAMVDDSPATNTTTSAPVADFGLEDGEVYQIAVFHAERQSEGSSFKLGITGLDVSRSTCVKD